MTKEQFAALLNGRSYRNEMTRAEEAEAKRLGLLVVFGASDDLMEFAGAFRDEVDCYNGGAAYFDADGLLPNWDDICDSKDTARLWLEREKGMKKIEALWCAEGDYSWTYRTDLPHAAFDIMEDGEPYCRGIVIDIKELA